MEIQSEANLGPEAGPAKWNDLDSRPMKVSSPYHYETLINGLWRLYTSQKQADFFFQWGGRSIVAHRLIVNLFLPANKLVQTACDQRFTKPEASGDGLGQPGNIDCLLEFLYTGTITVPNGQLDSLLEFARHLDFKMLIDALEGARRESRLPEDPGDGFVEPKVEFNEGSDSEEEGFYGAQVPVSESGRGAPGSNRTLGPDTAVGSGRKAMEMKLEAPAGMDGQDSSEEGYVGAPQAMVSIGEGVHASWQPPDIPHSYPEHPGIQHNDVGLASNQCQSCGYVFKKAGSLERHLCPKRLQYCTFCPYSTCHRQDLNVHMSRHDPSIELIKCGQCKRSFASQASLERHKCTQGLGSSSRCMQQCTYCPYSTSHKRDFIVHMAKHDPSIEVFKCRLCSRSFSSLTSRERHKCRPNLSHCPHCDYQTSNMRDFGVHMTKHDPNVKVLRCEVCRRPYLSEKALRRHKCVRRGSGDEGGGSGDRSIYEYASEMCRVNDAPTEAELVHQHLMAAYSAVADQMDD